MIAQYRDSSASKQELLKWVDIPRSSWYYMPSGNQRGIKPSTHTFKTSGEKATNEEVLDEIKKVLSDGLEFYGYEKVSWELKEKGYIINRKKVYRLMKEGHLLLTREKIKTIGKRNFIHSRKIEATHPLQYLAMDIKYVYIHQEKRFCYLLTVMDICTRFVLDFMFKPSIRKYDVVLLLEYILMGHDTEGIIIRNDNGSQFLAHQVRDHINHKKMNQEFTHISSPQENGYVESLFSILEKEMIRRQWFDSYYHAKMKIGDYFKVYNYKRKHRSLKRLSPYQYLNRFFPEFSDKHPFKFSDDLSRVSLDVRGESADTCLALDNSNENYSFVNRKISSVNLLN